MRDTVGPRLRIASVDAPAEYRAAVDLVRKGGKYEESIAALRAFLEHFPRHDYADNAQYWLGEAFYAQKDYAHALIEFRATIETYPRGNERSLMRSSRLDTVTRRSARPTKRTQSSSKS